MDAPPGPAHRAVKEAHRASSLDRLGLPQIQLPNCRIACRSSPVEATWRSNYATVCEADIFRKEISARSETGADFPGGTPFFATDLSEEFRISEWLKAQRRPLTS